MTKALSKLNWWKVGFLAALFVIELLREMVVIEAGSKAYAIPDGRLNTFGNMTVIQGQWVRTDGGDALVPLVTTIRCDEQRGECVESNYRIWGQTVFAPDISIFSAQFEPHAITFEDDFPLCATYSTEIDLNANEVRRVRVATEATSNGNMLCADRVLEKRVEMKLVGRDHPSLYVNPQEGHFVPLLSFASLFF